MPRTRLCAPPGLGRAHGHDFFHSASSAERTDTTFFTPRARPSARTRLFSLRGLGRAHGHDFFHSADSAERTDTTFCGHHWIAAVPTAAGGLMLPAAPTVS